MKIVHILEQKKRGINSISFRMPILMQLKELEEQGVRCQFFENISEQIFECDILVVTSKYFQEAGWWSNGSRKIVVFLQSIKEKKIRLIWADLTDGTGTTHFDVLPIVDRYWKPSILKNRAQYQQALHGYRVYTHYYHQHFNVTDVGVDKPHLNVIPLDEDLKKIFCSWSSAFYDYSFFGFQYWKVQNRFSFLPRFYDKKFSNPHKKRPLKLNARMNVTFKRKTITFQRQKYQELLREASKTQKVNRYQYLKELASTQMVLSPFGWGEIAFRDFETIRAGATLLKPNCDHMETWPNLYIADKTYLSLNWDFSNFEEVIHSDNKKGIEIAECMQEVYRKALFSKQSKQLFQKRFLELLNV